MGYSSNFVFRIDDKVFTFDELQSINPGRWKATQRLVNTIMTGYCFAGVMAIGAFQIGVATVLLNEFTTSRPYLSIVVGFVTGLAFPTVRDIVSQIRPVQKQNP